MVERLLEEFITEHTIVEKKKMNTQHVYYPLVQDLNAQSAQETADEDKKAKPKASRLQIMLMLASNRD